MIKKIQDFWSNANTFCRKLINTGTLNVSSEHIYILRKEKSHVQVDHILFSIGEDGVFWISSTLFIFQEVSKYSIGFKCSLSSTFVLSVNFHNTEGDRGCELNADGRLWRVRSYLVSSLSAKLRKKPWASFVKDLKVL